MRILTKNHPLKVDSPLHPPPNPRITPNKGDTNVEYTQIKRLGIKERERENDLYNFFVDAL